MMKAVKRKSRTSSDDFILMKNTRAMLKDVWDQALDTLGQTPDVAKRMMTAAIKEMHKLEMKSVKTKKHPVEKNISDVGSKDKANKRKLKTKRK